jgi:Putative zinc-finger
MATEEEHSITDQDRILAQLALATEEVADMPCPDVEMLALLVDGRLSEPDQEALFQHLAQCPSCYEQWRIMAEVDLGAVKKTSRAKIISITGGLLAAAASVILFINIGIVPTPTMAPQDEATVLGVSKLSSAEMSSMEQEDRVPSSQSVPDDMVQSQEMEEQMKEAATLLKNNSEAKTRQKKAASSKPSIRKGEMVENNAAYAPAPIVEDFTLLGEDVAKGEIVLDINRLIPTVVQKVKQAGFADVVEVKTYKRDRGFSVQLVEADQLLIREYGYRNREVTVPTEKLKRVLKNIVKIEFPRSNKVWLRVTSAREVEE